ncbi:dockerin type I domain-containing protein [Clostridium sp. SHJSY1]|uniref:fibronectin type III domain-containing protein n=1 Tax=Clostridium sp. SHJSY1 TaxID=2942483 RepID=UPI0028758A9E|nr:ZmpA/ZmpB/ZmpC family metallo-endopeptidase-related protein [Clostridium sp. SHJSY1]MDS0526066.1 dockerin type I domain-containing protein [Clostridium sp. SHJSY1]
MESKKLKKCKVFLFFITLLFGTITLEIIGSNKAYAFSGTGTGTSSDPYIISSKDQLKEVSSNLSANYKLGCDINLGNVEWAPIGNSTAQFSGVFDGAGHVLTNLSITKVNADGNSLFGYVNGGTIKNLSIKGVNINGESYTGAIAGNMSGTSVIDNCSADGSVTGNGNTGGLVGEANGLVISNSYSSVNVTGKGDNVGGVIGNLTGNITNCYATAEVVGQSGNYTGGLVGKEEGNITKSYTINDVSSNGSYAGGLTGWLHGQINQCYASGSVTAAGDDVGGLVGYSNSGNVIENSFNLGAVKGRNYIGGIQGYNAGIEGSNSTIKNSYSSGRIIVTGTGSGGLSGTNTTITGSYYDGVASKYAPQSVYDISKLSTAMKMSRTFKDWDLSGVWAIDEGTSYPYLRSVQKPDGVTAAPTGEVAGGTGTIDDPYIVSTAKQLQNIKYDVGASYKLANDVNIENIDWTAIGRNSAVPFTGTFDGNGHAIENFSGDYTNGLFGCVKGATIKNLSIKNVNISDGSYTGALASNVYGVSIIDNCSVIGGTVTGSGCTGGLIGIGNDVTITNSYSNISVVGKGDSVGGLVGSLIGTIKDCYVLGNVNSKSSNVGGIVGSFQGNISETYFSGNISGANNVGGLLGNSNAGIVKDCFSLGTISGNSYVGGILGNGNTTITNSYSAAKTSGSGTNIGGNSGTSTSVTDSYFDSRISGMKIPSEQSKDTKDLYNKDTYSNWDFTSTWSKDTQYPYLMKLPKPNFPIEIPDGLSVTDVTSTSMKITWNAVDGAIGYDIEVDGKVIDAGNNTSYECAGLTAGANHTYRVRTKTSSMASDWSSPVSQSTLSAVNNVNATVTSTSLKITWDAVAGVTNYDIEIDGKLITGLTDTSYELKDLVPGTVHTYRVRAITAAGIGDWSVLSSKTTLNLVNGIQSSVTSTSIKLIWNPINGATSYDVEVDDKLITGITNASYEITGLMPGTTHAYRIRAEFTDGSGDFSELTNATTLSVVTNVTSIVTSTSINVSWDKVEGATSYDIEVDGKVISDITDTSYIISGLTPGTSHTYRVRTTTAAGVGDWTELTTKVTLSAVTNVTSIVTSTSINVSWDKVDGAISYDIEVDGTVINNVTGTSYVISGLASGTTHNYRVRVITSEGVGDWTELTTKTTLSVVTNVQVTVTSTAINLSWDKVNEAIGYDIEVDGKVINNVAGTSCVISDLTPGTSHTYRVRVNTRAGIGNWTDLTTKYTLSVVTGVTSVATSTSIKVNWAEVERATGYDIEVDGKVITGITDTSYVISDLIPGTSHTYRVRVTTSAGVGEWTELTNKVILSTVSNITSTVASTSISVSWDKVDGAKGYDIEVDGKVIAGITDTNYIIGGLTAGTTHTYRVRAISEAGAGEWSEFTSKATLSAVTGVISIATSTSISVNWDKIEGATSYDIEVDGKVITGITDTSYVISGLTAGTSHTYKVRVTTAAGVGEWTDLITKTTLSIAANVASTVTSTSITVNWDKVDGAISYDIEVDGKVITGVTDTSYVISGLAAGTSHNYRVRVVFADGASDWSDLTTKSTLSAVINVGATATGKSISINWTAVTGAIGYDIEVDGKVITGITDTNYVISGLEAGTSHNYRLRVTTAAGVGEWTDLFNKVTLSVVANVTSTVATNSITLNWDKVDGATAYDVEVDGKIISDITGTSYVIAELISGTSHTYRVRAKIETGTGDWTEIATQSTLSLVENVTSTVTSSSMTVNWATVTGALSYDIEVDGKVITGVTGTSYLVTGLTAGTSHTYKVRVITSAGTGNWTTLSTQTTVGIVSNVTSTVTSTSMAISWAELAGALSYDIEVDGKIITGVTDTSYSITGLTAGTSHTYRVRVITSAGTGDWSEQITKSTLSVVTNVTSVVASTSITLNWDAIQDATSYEIEVDGKVITGVTGTSYVISDLTAGTNHTYRVRVITAEGTSDWNEIVTKSTLSLVTNVTAVVNSTSLTVNWATVTGALSYDVEVDGKIITGLTGTSYAISGLTPGTDHTYRVRVITSAGVGEWTALTTEATINVIGNVTSSVGSTSLTVNWAAALGALSYDIEVDGKVITGITGTSYAISGLTPGTNHTYRVRVVTSTGVGDWSEVVTQGTINVVANVTAVLSNNSMTVNWGLVTGATSYDIEVNGTLITGITGTSYVITGLTPGTTYTYRVRVNTSVGVGDWSNPVSKADLNVVVSTGVTAVVTGTSVNLSWGVIPGATGYDVEVDGVVVSVGNVGTYVATDLQPGITHTYRIRATTADGIGDWSDPIVKTALDVIIQGSVTAVATDTSVNVSWTPIAGATGYDIEVNGTVISGISGTSYVITGLEPGATVTYRIRPTTASGVGAWSEVVSQTTLSVVGGVVSTTDSTSISVSWGAVTGALSYDIEVDGKVITGVTGASYVISGLTPGTDHTYRVRVITSAGVGVWSDIVTKGTLSVVGGVVSVTDSTSISVSWGAVTGALSYDIEVDGKVITGVTGASYVISGLTPGTDHTYRVRVITSAGVGVWSDIVTKGTLSVVGSVVSVTDSTSISVSWGAVTGALSYDIEVDGKVITGVTGISYVVTGLEPGTSHTYRVRVVTSAGVGVWSDVVTKTTLSIVTNVTSTVDISSMAITWATVTGAISYDIEVDGKIITGITASSYTVSGLTSGTSHNYRVRAITAAGTGTWSDLGKCSILFPTAISIQGDKTTISSGSTLVVYVSMKNCNNISSEYIDIQYDNKAFQFVNSEVTNTDKFQISDEENSGDGHLVFIGGSNGQENSINSDSQILKLTFKVNQDVAQGEIIVTTAIVGDVNDKVYEATCSGQIFKIVTGDVNGDDKVTIDDMAIASKLVGTNSSKWGSYTPDVNGDGKVDNEDLKIIAKHITH